MTDTQYKQAIEYLETAMQWTTLEDALEMFLEYLDRYTETVEPLGEWME